MPERGFTVRISTAGTPSPGYGHLSGGYRYKGDPEWVPNDPRYRNGAEAPDEPRPANATRTAGRAARLEEFAGYLAQGLTPQQAGKLLGIARTTVRAYERELQEQQRGERRDA